MVYLLWYRGESGFQGVHAWIDKLCNTYGFSPIVIDKERGDKKGTKNGFTYSSINYVLKNPKFKNHKWIWMDSKGDKFLDEYEHPKDKAIYCVGSDFGGFEGKDIKKLKGDKIKIRQDEPDDWFAAMVVPLLVYDRYLYLKGRRK